MKDFSSPKNLSHFPVMLEEVLKICNPSKGGNFIDCTFGYGGYTNAILSYPKTKVLAIDRDLNTKKFADRTKKNYKNRFTFHNKKFSDLSKVADKKTKFDFIVFDLGISTMQIMDKDRGFSFNSNSSIDMRMGLNSISAQEVVNSFSQSTLNDIFKFFGEEKESFKISKNIIETRKKNPNTTIEILTPDFLRKGEAYKNVIAANPDVFNHNIETVPRLYTTVRPGARYFASLELLKNAKKFNKKVFTKSGIMVGLGENKEEVIQVMDDLRSAEVDFITIGQYLQPSPKHHPLNRYYHPDEFKEFEQIAKTKGFLLVSSSPLTRSSYHADEDFRKLQDARNKQLECLLHQ